VTLDVVEPGLLTTVQDGGRPDFTHLGVPIGGACDTWSLAVANLLAGADAAAAALEMTIVGPTLAVREPITIGLAGADLGGVVRETGRRLAPGRSHALAAGTTVAFPGVGPDGAARAYLALPGGIHVPEILGSASTLLSAGFGGVEGRALRVGDVVRGRVGPATADGGTVAERSWPWLDIDPLAGLAQPGPVTLRIITGPTTGADTLVAGEWRVRPDSDRIGLRLERAPAAETPPLPASGELLTHGVVRGAIQLPPGGTPLVLLADHQTTGGYPVAAVVARADHPLLGQLRPGAAVRFVATTPDEARAAYVAQAEALERGAAACRADDRWDQLWQSAR
jgi:antagonist of KipI